MMKQKIFLQLTFLFLALIASPLPTEAQEKSPSIFISDNFETTLKDAKKQNLPIILYFSSATCKHCRNMENYWKSKSIQGFNNQFLFVRLDIEKDRKTAKRYEAQITPQLFLLNQNGEKIQNALGELTEEEIIKTFTYWSKITSEEIPEKNDLTKTSQHPKKLFTEVDQTPDGFRGDGICFSNVGYGPLRLSTQSPFQSLRYTFQPRTPSTLIKGQFELHLHDTWVNIWSRDENDYLMDFETNSTVFYAAYAFTDNIQLEVQYENRSRFGGQMDGFIQGFHDLFDIDQNGRKDVPKNAIDIQFSETDGFPEIEMREEAKGLFYHNLSTTFQHNITCGGQYTPALSYSVTLGQSLYNKDQLYGKIPFDASASISISKRYKNFYGYASMGFTVFGNNKLNAGSETITLARSQGSALSALEWKFRPSMSLSLQYLVTQGAISNRKPFNRFSHEITLGYSWEFKNNFLFQFGMIENMFVHDNSPDFGLFSAITIRL